MKPPKEQAEELAMRCARNINPRWHQPEHHAKTCDDAKTIIRELDLASLLADKQRLEDSNIQKDAMFTNDESQDWERWAKEVCEDFKIPFDNHKVGLRIAITQWMAEQKEKP